MVDYVKEMREKYKDKKQFVEKFVDSLLGKSVKQQYGLDNMSVIFIDFVWIFFMCSYLCIGFLEN